MTHGLSVILKDSVEVASGGALVDGRVFRAIHHSSACLAHGAAQTRRFMGCHVGYAQTPLYLYKVHRSEVFVQESVKNGVDA